MAQVWALALPSEMKFVLLAFADHADDDGMCRPSVEYVSWKTGYGERQVQRIGRQLRESGLMVPVGVYDQKQRQVKQGKPGRGQFVMYQVRPEKGVKLSSFMRNKGASRDTLLAVKGDKSAQERVTNTAEKGVTTGQNRESILYEPSVEPSEVTISKEERPLASAGAAAPARYIPPEWAISYLRVWNENRGLLPECRELPKGRVDKLRVRGGAPVAGTNEPTPFAVNFLEAVKRSAATPFLRGDNDRGWRCSFDYLIANDTNILEILEGKFEGGGHGKSGSNRGPRNAVHSEGADGYGERPNRVVLNL